MPSSLHRRVTLSRNIFTPEWTHTFKTTSMIVLALRNFPRDEETRNRGSFPILSNTLAVGVILADYRCNYLGERDFGGEGKAGEGKKEAEESGRSGCRGEKSERGRRWQFPVITANPYFIA